ncbi:MAG: 2-amino-4-hydroxy-6-hydroxymethyldihydropteridine diphosphokinase [Elusimicrobia bacterium]|nr:2-amino-4-hydroxy-6-hydroxymethyldihydropteridine diphosphokinase [Elusimicrobiota bacterium]MDE2236841.1 2-amino-4-hydroxy-6-hydroxymethyldihydropteridine diphosphokinase [Elusimicrobiota bacterium]MDE2425815.1 2-amino-4-hydroxy-6-hydroxymethyldihydropteridine diphosphokinase [Elusimicrobiota bacterium]
MAETALLLLGGNKGQRLRRLRWAKRALAALPGSRLLRRSRVYETAPVGPSRRPYLNAALALRTSLSPMGLLVECKRLEALAGRRAGRRWAARPLDIDILAFGSRRLSGPWLTLPHRRLCQRAFALAPLRDIAPSLRLPGGGTAASRLAVLKPPASSVRIFADAL